MLLVGRIDSRQEALLKVLCSGTASSLASRLRNEVKPEDCKADFIGAASLYALAALSDVDENTRPETFVAGDLEIRRGNSAAAANCLRAQAELMIRPYLKDGFSFRGV